MTGGIASAQPLRRRGQAMVEFSLVTLLTVIMLLFIVELSRMVLVYTTVANAARAGLRYAMVHGSSRPTTGCLAVDCASGPGNNPGAVVTVIDNFAGAGLLTTSLLVKNVTYPDASNAPGQPVNVSVVYPYDPLVTYFTNTLLLGSAAQGVIVY